MKPKNQESRTEIVKANGGIHIKTKQLDLRLNHSDRAVNGREKQ
tara:strand:+ start:209 stop:340 length:132 start_codon:yes stop_codon:yes gene_type:complete